MKVRLRLRWKQIQQRPGSSPVPGSSLWELRRNIVPYSYGTTNATTTNTQTEKPEATVGSYCTEC
jgi:hypothetical protein